jgi:hypothetical protein
MQAEKKKRLQELGDELRVKGARIVKLLEASCRLAALGYK